MNSIRIYLTAALILASMSSYAALNKWVDEHGKVHYGDRVPSQYLKKDRQILSEQGVVVRRIEAKKTEEQLQEEQKSKSKESEAARKKMIEDRKKALRDRVLLETFTTERDLVIARDDRIGAVDSQIQLTESNIKDQEKKLEAVRKQITDIEKSGREVPENTRKEVVSVSRQLETYYQYVENKNIERNEIMKKFDEDIKRFRELKSGKVEKAQAETN